MGETQDGSLRPDFDRRVMLQFCGSVVTSDGGLLAYRELDDALGLTTVAGGSLADARTGKNGRHALVGMLRQSVFGRLAGYEDVNDAVRLRHDPAMRWIIGGKAAKGTGASTSQMGRFETNWLARPENLATLTDLSGHWIDQVAKHRSRKRVVLDNRGRDARYRAPPAQIPAGAIRAPGPHLGCLTANRWFGHGWRIRGSGSHLSAAFPTVSSEVRSFWLRRRSVRYQSMRTCCGKAAKEALLVGTA